MTAQPLQAPRLRKVLVVGATGGTGRETVLALRRAGYAVTAFSRSASRWVASEGFDDVAAFDGDATDPRVLDEVVPGHDAVVVTLGISENPFRVRLFGTRGTPADVRSVGTRAVIAAMLRHGLRRIVVLSSYGVGSSRHRLGWMDRLFFDLVLKPQIQDTEVQEELVRRSALEWLVVQPVHLTEEVSDAPAFASEAGDTRGMQVSRRSVAQYMVDALARPELARRVIALSG